MKNKVRIGILSLIMTIAVAFCASCSAKATNATTFTEAFSKSYYTEKVDYYEVLQHGIDKDLKKIAKDNYEDNANVEKKYRDEKEKEELIAENPEIAAYVIIPGDEFPPTIILTGVTDGGTKIGGTVTVTIDSDIPATNRYRIDGGTWVSFSSPRNFSTFGFYQINSTSLYGTSTVTFTISDNYYASNSQAGSNSLAYARVVTSIRYYPLTRSVTYQAKAIWDVVPFYRQEADILTLSFDTRQSDVWADPNRVIQLQTTFRRKDAVVTYDNNGGITSVTYNEYDVSSLYNYGFNGSTPKTANQYMEVTEHQVTNGKTSFTAKAYTVLPKDGNNTTYPSTTTTITVTTKVNSGWIADLGCAASMAHTVYLDGPWDFLVEVTGFFRQNWNIVEFIMLTYGRLTSVEVPSMYPLLSSEDFSIAGLMSNGRVSDQFTIHIVYTGVIIDL